jgi:drug/metabolite transporter (DMT)-like permease
MTASVLAALAAASCFAGAAVLQQEAAQATSPEESLKLRLLVDLLRRPKWLTGVALLVGGYGFQALALAYGPVGLVQPIVVTELAIAIPIAMWRRHRHPLPRDWIGITAVLGGVSGFLILASPAEGIGNPDTPTWIACLVPVSTIVVILVALAAPRHGPRRAMLLGAAAGCAFGLLAVLTKATTYQLSHNITAALTSWQPYLLIAAGIAALVISQSAYQAGPLAYSMPLIAVLEPLLSVLIGATAFGEEIRLTGGYLIAQAVTALTAIAGITVLATSPTVLSIYQEQTRRPVGNGRRGERLPQNHTGLRRASRKLGANPRATGQGRAGEPYSPVKRNSASQGPSEWTISQ